MEQAEIRPLAPERGADFLHYFDRDAFQDNPRWAACYCQFYLVSLDEKPWDQRTKEENRALAGRRIAAGEMHGYLAYLDGRVVGWCHAAPLRLLPNLHAVAGLSEAEIDQTGGIVCFNVAQPYRRQGIAAQLLEAACAGFQARGLEYAMGTSQTVHEGDAPNYHGPLAMYLDAGFEVVRKEGDFAIVRKKLGGV